MLSHHVHAIFVVIYHLFVFNYTATPAIYTYLHTLSLHDALPISALVNRPIMFAFTPRMSSPSMRNTSIDLLDAIPRAVVAIGTDYPHGHLLPSHHHRRAQLLYGATGVMQVRTEDGNWVVPPQGDRKSVV